MKRFTYLYGTNSTNEYRALGGSKGLEKFLKEECNAENIPAVLEAVQKTVSDGYVPSLGKEESVIAVRYAPMHLYKQKNRFPNMKEFCTMGFSCLENNFDDKKRNTSYEQLVFMDYQMLIASVTENGLKFNYLDQLFGGSKITWPEITALRNRKTPINWDVLPKKVEPIIPSADLPLILNVCRAIYERKAVIIRLEPRIEFSLRAERLLTGIYSLLPPPLAVETGFAAYIDPQRIQNYYENTSIRIFVLPAEVSMDDFTGSNYECFDLTANKTFTVTNEPIFTALGLWASISWAHRQPVMQTLFKDTASSGQYFDAELFVNRTEAFFKDPFFRWVGDETPVDLSTLEQIRERYNSFPVCKYAPWIQAMFVQKIPVLQNEKSFKSLISEVLANALYGEKDQQKYYQELFLFAASLGTVDPIEASACTARKALDQAAPLYKAELAKKNAEIQAERQKTIDAISAGRSALDNEIAKATQRESALRVMYEQKFEEERNNTAQAIQKGQELLEKQQKEYDNAFANLVDRHASELAAERELTKKTRMSAQMEIQKLQENYQTEVASINIAHSQALDKEKAISTALTEELASTKAALKNSEASVNRIKLEAEAYVKREAAAAKKVQDKAKKDALSAQQLLAENEKKAAQLDDKIKNLQRNRIIFTMIGFAAAAIVIFAGLLMSNILKKPSEGSDVLSTEVTAATVAPTESVPHEVIEPVEPTDATEEGAPNEEDPIQAILQGVPELKQVEAIDLQTVELNQFEGFEQIALFQYDNDDTAPESRSLIVLMRAVNDENIVSEEAESESLQTEEVVQRATERDANGTEDGVEKNLEDVNAVEEMPQEASYVAASKVRISLQDDEYLVYALGEDESIVYAMKAFAMLHVTDEAPNIEWKPDGEHDIGKAVHEYTGNDMWWTMVSRVCTSVEELQQTIRPQSETPLIFLEIGDEQVFFALGEQLSYMPVS